MRVVILFLSVQLSFAIASGCDSCTSSSFRAYYDGTPHCQPRTVERLRVIPIICIVIGYILHQAFLSSVGLQVL